jgi:hypothetical protein
MLDAMLDTGYSILDGEDLFPLRKGGLRGLFDCG